ncbi:MAG: hypothetical protein K2X08_02090 [Chlamydiales bacterium]|nr:hypothetical protein [Chlamydiales bacterium]
MSTLTIATSVSRNNTLALSTSAMQTLSKTKEALTQRVDALRAELQALPKAHATTMASLQAEQKKLDLSITDQQAKNAALRTINNDLRGKLTLYQRTLNAHRCSPHPLDHFFLEKNRIFSRARGDSIETFLYYLRLT